MWLLPAFSALSALATRSYFRLSLAGARVPADGPVLLVANHPNSLLDPALVVAAAGRPVRFLAKAPLFSDPLIGWLIRGVGAIPVYRRQDDPSLMQHNETSLAAASTALAAGAAIGLFPEGTSHDEPALAPLRTGAARIALGAAALHRRAVPIVPVGLVFREKQTFRSAALVLVGEPIAWDDLAALALARSEDPGADDAVRALTDRITVALRSVTLNLERWQDAPLVDAAAAIWAAEQRLQAGDALQLERRRMAAERLAELRRSGDARWEAVAGEVLRHDRLLARLGLSADALRADAAYRARARRSLRELPIISLAALSLGAAGSVLFWPPYALTGKLAALARPDRTVLATTKLFVGVLTYGAWIALLASAMAFTAGVVAGAFALVALPLVAVATLWLRERWAETRGELRRFHIKRTRRSLITELRARQQQIAADLAALLPVGNG